MTRLGSPLAAAFRLDPAVVYLNHGSFGACPSAVLAAQAELRDALEREPVRFLAHRYECAIDRALAALGRFVGARPEDLAFVTNATTAVNTVLRAFPFRSGDRVLLTDHGYQACRNAVEHVAARRGLEIDVAEIPFPLRDPEQVVEAVLAKRRPRTRLALLDHVTSPTALVLPVERLVPALEAEGVAVLVDGAHALGMLELDLDRLGASYYTSNAHKWLCAPKGAAFLHARADRQAALRPLVISHGASSPRTDRSRFELEMGWTGTFDPSAVLSVPAAIERVGALLPGGWPAIRAHNHGLAVRARAILLEALDLAPACPAEMLGAMASIPLGARDPFALQDRLFDAHGIEVPVMPWPRAGQAVLRVSAQLYNAEAQYECLAEALKTELRAPG